MQRDGVHGRGAQTDGYRDGCGDTYEILMPPVPPVPVPVWTYVWTCVCEKHVAMHRVLDADDG